MSFLDVSNLMEEEMKDPTQMEIAENFSENTEKI